MSQQRYCHKQNADVPEKNDDCGKQVTLLGNIRLSALQNMPRQGHMEAIAGAQQEMEPDREVFPVPKPISRQKQKHRHDRVQRKKIRSKSDNEVVLSHDNVA